MLVESLNNSLPEKMIRRNKTGFTVPVEKWMETDNELDEWRRVPELRKKGTPWARRWAYTVMARQKNPILREEITIS